MKKQLRLSVYLIRKRTGTKLMIDLPKPMGELETIGWLEFEFPGWEILV